MVGRFRPLLFTRAVTPCIAQERVVVDFAVFVWQHDVGAMLTASCDIQDLPGLTDTTRPRRLGPKRASRIRKLFNLTKDDDVRKYVIRRNIEKDGKVTGSKAPKIQRLVTPQVLQRKRARLAFKKERREKGKTEAAEYKKLLAQRHKEAADRKHAQAKKKRRLSHSASEA